MTPTDHICLDATILGGNQKTEVQIFDRGEKRWFRAMIWRNGRKCRPAEFRVDATLTIEELLVAALLEIQPNTNEPQKPGFTTGWGLFCLGIATGSVLSSFVIWLLWLLHN